MGQIYLITNHINNKGYVGQTTRTAMIRWNEHKKNIESLKSRLPLYAALDKYGIENFSVTVLEDCDNEKLNEREIFWIKEKKTFGEQGYNCTTGGQGNVLRQDINLDLPIIKERYLLGERLDALCKEFGHDYISVRNRLIKDGVKINTFAGPQKLSKKIYQYSPEDLNCLGEFPSISAAARAICPPGNNYRAIANHISKQKNTNNVCHGYIWRTERIE